MARILLPFGRGRRILRGSAFGLRRHDAQGAGLRPKTLVSSILITALLAGAPALLATGRIQKQAQKAGHAEASDCKYCHSFDNQHMRDNARKMGISNLNCYACHGNKLPVTGRALFNDRGFFLVEQKFKRKAAEVDVSWLSEFPGDRKTERKPDRQPANH